MPRPPSYPSVIRSAREIIHWTQVTLAVATKIPKPTLNKIENGQLAVSRTLSDRIAAEIFVESNQIFTNDDPLRPRLLGGGGELLTLENWENRRQAMSRVPKALYDRELKELTRWLERALRDSARAGKFYFVTGALRDSIVDVRMRFGLITSKPQDLELESE